MVGECKEGSVMSKYAELIGQKDFYEREAYKHKHNPLKMQIFKMLAKQYERKALKLTIEEALR